MFAASALLIRVCILALDSRPRFFLGDSMSYLETGFGRFIPNDRSWMYGLLINALIRGSHSLTSVILLQSITSSLLCTSVAVLCLRMGVRKWLAWMTLILLSLDPLLLYYDRSIMTDAPGTMAVVLGLLLAADSMIHESWWSWCGSALCLLAAISLRTALLPLVVWVPICVLGYRVSRALRSSPVDHPTVSGRLSQHLAGPLALVTLVVIGLVAYSHATGALTNSPPSLNPRSGYFLLGVVAPNLAPEDFAGLGVENPAEILEQTRHRDRTLRNRQVFSPQGLAVHLESALGSDWLRVSRAGSVLARRSITRDPVGFAVLCLEQAWDYFSFAAYPNYFDIAYGLERQLPDQLVNSLRSRVMESVTHDMPARPSVVLAWLRLTLHWPGVLCWLALLTPGVALAAARRLAPTLRGSIILLATSTWVLLASVFAFSPEVVPRYILPLAPLAFALLALAVEALTCGALRGHHQDFGTAPL
jgi:4-amino-4-deoxy-L-arabinose transferase-like glycosyltransferase